MKKESNYYLLDGGSVLEIEGRNRSTSSTTTQGKDETLMTNYETPLMPKNKGWIEWGAGNKFPEEVSKILSRNPIADGLIGTKSDFISGRDFVFYQKRFEDGELYKDYVSFPEGEDWLEENEIKMHVNRWTYDYVLLGNFGVKMNRAMSNTKIASVEHEDPNLWRVGQVEKGKAINYKFGDWIHNNKPAYELPVFDRASPLQHEQSFLHIKNYHPGSFYYGVPDWIGAENFIRLLNEIPVWHLSGLRNGYNIRWHIEIPAEYFNNTPKEERQAKEEDLRDELNKFLSGSVNNGKAIVTKFFTDNQGKPVQGIKITPLKAELFDDAFTALFEQGMIAVCSGHGINPSLAGVILNGQLSSGSELRNAYNVYLQLKVPRFRDAILKPLQEVKRANNWPKEYHIGLTGHQVTKLDENSEGGVDVMSN